jgi:hypothetical protein
MSFDLQFDAACIPALARLYRPEQDDAALAAGARIRDGKGKRAELSAIFEWKTKGRGRSRLSANTDEEVADALSLAAAAKTTRSALAVLRGLRGVDVPVASAILTAINPDRYTIIDFRALAALGHDDSPPYSADFYLAYLEECRRLAEVHQVGLRDLDRALWQWSKNHPNAGSAPDIHTGKD